MPFWAHVTKDIHHTRGKRELQVQDYRVPQPMSLTIITHAQIIFLLQTIAAETHTQ